LLVRSDLIYDLNESNEIDGVFYAELNEFFTRELAEEGYSGVEVRVTPTVTDISMSEFLGGDNTDGSSYPCNTHTRGSRRARSPNSRVDLAQPKALQVPRKLCVSLRRQGPEQRSLCRRAMRIPSL
jgi:hypothetical protein